MPRMNLFSKTGLTIAAIVFALWIIGPLVLSVVFRLLNTSGGNIGLLIGFLHMVAMIGVVFAAAYAVAAYFGKPWLIAAPVLIVIVTSVVSHFRPHPEYDLSHVKPDTSSPATALANQPGVELEHLLHFATATMSEASAAAVAKVAQTRQPQLAGHITKDRGFHNNALYAASLLTTNATPELLAAVQAYGQSLAAQLRRFNELNIASDCQYLGRVYRDSFQAWSTAWLALHRQGGLDGRAPLQQILELAQVRSRDCEAINELRLAAQRAIGGLSPDVAQ